MFFVEESAEGGKGAPGYQGAATGHKMENTYQHSTPVEKVADSRFGECALVRARAWRTCHESD